MCAEHEEDDIHFLLQCPVYHDLRVKYLSPFHSLPNEIPFTSLLQMEDSNMITGLSLYIYHSIQRRKTLWRIVIVMYQIKNSYSYSLLIRANLRCVQVSISKHSLLITSQSKVRPSRSIGEHSLLITRQSKVRPSIHQWAFTTDNEPI